MGNAVDADNCLFCLSGIVVGGLVVGFTSPEVTDFFAHVTVTVGLATMYNCPPIDNEILSHSFQDSSAKIKHKFKRVFMYFEFLVWCDRYVVSETFLFCAHLINNFHFELHAGYIVWIHIVFWARSCHLFKFVIPISNGIVFWCIGVAFAISARPTSSSVANVIAPNRIVTKCIFLGFYGSNKHPEPRFFRTVVSFCSDYISVACIIDGVTVEVFTIQIAFPQITIWNNMGFVRRIKCVTPGFVKITLILWPFDGVGNLLFFYSDFSLLHDKNRLLDWQSTLCTLTVNSITWHGSGSADARKVEISYVIGPSSSLSSKYYTVTVSSLRLYHERQSFLVTIRKEHPCHLYFAPCPMLSLSKLN